MNGRKGASGHVKGGKGGRSTGRDGRRPPESGGEDAEIQEHASVAPDDPPAGTYRVGYAKPPPETRFRKGKSGNPAGRPKKSKNLRTAMREVLTKPVAVRNRQGVVRMVPGIIAATEVTMQAALHGDLPSLKTLLSQLPIVDDPQQPATPADALSGRDSHEMLRRYLAARPDLLASKRDSDGGDA